MNLIENIFSHLKKILTILPLSNNIIMNLYLRSIFYRKKHIKKNNYEWLKNIELGIINPKEGVLNYNDFEYILSKNILKNIPLHQKYLYAALIGQFRIPSYYLLFWNDLIAFYEVFVKKVYEKDFKVKKGDTILDIGASIGWYAIKIAKSLGNNCKIILIEPNPENIMILKKNLEINGINNAIIVEKGVWSSQKELFLEQDFYSSKILNIKDKRTSKKKIVKIKVDKIDNIISELNLDRVDIIKMDIEGSELEALKGAEKLLKKSQKLKLIIAAYHKDSLGVPTFRRILPYLERLNYKINHKNLPYIYAQK